MRLNEKDSVASLALVRNSLDEEEDVNGQTEDKKAE